MRVGCIQHWQNLYIPPPSKIIFLNYGPPLFGSRAGAGVAFTTRSAGWANSVMRELPRC